MNGQPTGRAGAGSFRFWAGSCSGSRSPAEAARGPCPRCFQRTRHSAAMLLVLEAGIHHRHTPGRMGESGGGGSGTLESVSQWAEEISSQTRRQGLRASEGHIPPWLNSWSVLMEKKDPEFLHHQTHSSPHTCVPHHSARPV